MQSLHAVRTDWGYPQTALVRTLAVLAGLAAAVSLASASHAARQSGNKTGSPQQFVAPAGSGALFIFSGHGYGHGVGMGQWGAQGYAEQGYTYDQILNAYYPGTGLGQTSTTSIRVLLTSGQKKLTISSKKSFTVTDGDGVEHTLPAGTTTFGTGLKLAVDGGPATALPSPLTFAPSGSSTLTLGRAYRGQILVDAPGKKLRAINELPLEQYLYGVVTAEMPSAWQSAALEAQAVAARSYALANRKAAAPFDVYADGRSQAYLGVSAETVAGRQAVDETDGQVLLYGSSIADTLFSSSTGGWSQSAADAFGPPGRPYLVSVEDPYDTISPYHNWGPIPVTGQTLGSALGVSGRAVDATVKRNSSKRVKTLQVSALSGGAERSSSITGATTASALSLRSTWFSVGVLSLQPPSPNSKVVPGTSVTLSGVVRGVKDAVVQKRSGGGAWQQLRSVVPGSFSLAVKPQVTTQYRLANANDAAAPIRIRVQTGTVG